MMVWLSPELFESPTDDLPLLGLFEHGWQGEHRVYTDLADPTVARWLAGQKQGVREQCELAVDASAHEEALQPTTARIIVVVAQHSDWSSSPPRVCLADARVLLRQRFEILVEDSESDRAFLLKMMTQDELRLIDDLEHAQRLEFVHGGGSRLKMLVEQRAEDPRTRLQMWVLFDSDALYPAKPSPYSKEICEICRRHGLPFHQLSRRFIESYLPPAALERWGSQSREKRMPVVRAFKRMSPRQRHHYNMKEGFAKDRPREAEVGSLYDDLTDRDRERLESGFGHKIGALFQDRHANEKVQMHATRFVQEQDLRHDGGWEELRPAVRELFARLGVSA